MLGREASFLASVLLVKALLLRSLALDGETRFLRLQVRTARKRGQNAD